MTLAANILSNIFWGGWDKLAVPPFIHFEAAKIIAAAALGFYEMSWSCNYTTLPSCPLHWTQTNSFSVWGWATGTVTGRQTLAIHDRQQKPKYSIFTSGRVTNRDKERIKLPENNEKCKILVAVVKLDRFCRGSWGSGEKTIVKNLVVWSPVYPRAVFRTPNSSQCLFKFIFDCVLLLAWEPLPPVFKCINGWMRITFVKRFNWSLRLEK